MSFDDTDFIDREFQASAPTSYAPPSPEAVAGAVSGPSMSTPSHGATRRPPTREELETKVSETQSKLSDLRRAQEELERERAALEESRRRRIEFQTGREEMVHQLTRGITTLEESEFAARQEAEQMSRSLSGLRDGLAKVQSIHEDQWTAGNWSQELTRALTLVDNARMEWNTARIKWPRLSNAPQAGPAPPAGGVAAPAFPPKGLPWERKRFLELTQLGLAFTWPVLVTGVVVIVLLGALLARGR